MTIIIDSVTFDVPVESLKRIVQFQDKYSERVETGELVRELVGVYFNYRLVFGKTHDAAVYAALWAKLTEAVEFHTVTVPDESGEYTFTAAFSDVSDEAGRVRAGRNIWEKLTVIFVAQEPENIP